MELEQEIQALWSECVELAKQKGYTITASVNFKETALNGMREQEKQLLASLVSIYLEPKILMSKIGSIGSSEEAIIPEVVTTESI